MKGSFLVILLTLFQSEQKPANKEVALIKEGNNAYIKQQWQRAADNYAKSGTGNYRHIAAFNKGNALFKQQQYEPAIVAYQQASDQENGNKTLRADAYYNKGVVYSTTEQIPESIEAYKSALRLHPEDNDARENLQKALLNLKKQSGGASSEQPPASSDNHQPKMQTELNRLENKERSIQQKLSAKKNQYGVSEGKDW